MAESGYSVALNSAPSRGELSVLFSGHSEPLGGHSVGPQILDYHLVHYIVSGKGVFRCLDREHPAGPGDSFFIFPGEMVSYTADEEQPWAYRWIGFKGSRAVDLLDAVGVSPLRPLIGGARNRLLAALFGLAERVLRESGQGSDLRAGGILRLALGEWAQIDDKPAAGRSEDASEAEMQIDKAVRLMALQYNRPFSVEELAHELGYHRTYFSKIFKRHTGMSPQTFLLKTRMEQAKILLERPLSIQQVAMSVGFADALYFSKQFRKWFGSSPSEYRRTIRS